MSPEDGPRPDISVVIPVFNEEGCLGELYRRLTETLQGVGDPYEIICVNDGSTDQSEAILDRLAADDPCFRVIHFTRNFGQHPAVYAGFGVVRGERVVTLDADLQNPPEEIPKLLATLEEGVDVVAGVRAVRHDSIFRSMPSKVVNWMVGRMTRVPLRDYGCLLRVYRREVIELLLQCTERTKYFTALISWLGVRIVEVDVDHAPRAAGESKYDWWKLISINFDLLTGFSIFPIQAISIGGLILAGLGMLLSVTFFTVALIASTDLWWWLLMLSGVSLALGVQVATIGLIGEYIGRILIEVKARPYYLVRREVNGRTPGERSREAGRRVDDFAPARGRDFTETDHQSPRDPAESNDL